MGRCRVWFYESPPVAPLQQDTARSQMEVAGVVRGGVRGRVASGEDNALAMPWTYGASR